MMKIIENDCINKYRTKNKSKNFHIIQTCLINLVFIWKIHKADWPKWKFGIFRHIYYVPSFWYDGYQRICIEFYCKKDAWHFHWLQEKYIYNQREKWCYVCPSTIILNILRMKLYRNRKQNAKIKCATNTYIAYRVVRHVQQAVPIWYSMLGISTYYYMRLWSNVVFPNDLQLHVFPLSCRRPFEAVHFRWTTTQLALDDLCNINMIYQLISF